MPAMWISTVSWPNGFSKNPKEFANILFVARLVEWPQPDRAIGKILFLVTSCFSGVANIFRCYYEPTGDGWRFACRNHGNIEGILSGHYPFCSGYGSAPAKIKGSAFNQSSINANRSF